MKKCKLCDLVAGNHRTRVYCEDKKIIIVDCPNCSAPIGIWKEHKVKLNPNQIKYLVAKMEFSLGILGDFREPREIKSHYHLHFIRLLTRKLPGDGI